MTFHALAEIILREADTPLTANEIWERAIAKGLDQKLSSKGKTPWATLGAQLYVRAKENAGSIFKTVGKRPKRFYLKDKVYQNFEAFESGKVEEEMQAAKAPGKKPAFLEKDLHPYLAHFAYYTLRCHTKTISHLKSDRKEYGDWVHPDMVGCIFPDWDDDVLNLSAAVGNTAIRFLSFELKRELNLSTLRSYFFQAVSNSSWANEGYLVAADISQNEDFQDELARLSASFGIGVIQLDVESPNSSRILLPARFRESMDWQTIDKLTMNKDFKEFLRRVKNDLTSKEIRKEWYDRVWEEEELVTAAPK